MTRVEKVMNKLRKIKFKPKLLDFIKWVIIDIHHVMLHGIGFKEYGLTMYCGRQGAGKTIGMLEYLERMRVKYPNALIITNFGYVNESQPLETWRDLLEVRNGLDGVIFAIDEIQNEYSSSAWKDFPEDLLSEITQQRKQRVKIVATSQVYTRVVKQLREQCFEVVECRTLGNRWTFMRAFDAEDYNTVIDNPDKKRKLRRVWRRNFIQDDAIRNLYDSYAKIERLKKATFIPRHERNVN